LPATSVTWVPTTKAKAATTRKAERLDTTTAITRDRPSRRSPPTMGASMKVSSTAMASGRKTSRAK